MPRIRQEVSIDQALCPNYDVDRTLTLQETLVLRSVLDCASSSTRTSFSTNLRSRH